jgi:hypothetical protein
MIPQEQDTLAVPYNIGNQRLDGMYENTLQCDCRHIGREDSRSGSGTGFPATTVQDRIEIDSSGSVFRVFLDLRS